MLANVAFLRYQWVHYVFQARACRGLWLWRGLYKDWYGCYDRVQPLAGMTTVPTGVDLRSVMVVPSAERSCLAWRPWPGGSTHTFHYAF